MWHFYVIEDIAQCFWWFYIAHRLAAVSTCNARMFDSNPCPKILSSVILTVLLPLAYKHNTLLAYSRVMSSGMRLTIVSSLQIIKWVNSHITDVLSIRCTRCRPIQQEAQLLLGDRTTRKHAKDCWNGRGNDNLGWNDLQMYFKVIKSGTNRKLVYDFPLVVCSNFCRITHHFWEIWRETVQWP